MSFKTENKDSYSIITSNVDKVNSSNSQELKDIITDLNKNSLNNVIIDLSNTTYCDSSGLSAILYANRMCKNTNGNIVLTGLKPMVKKLIEIAQLHRILNITETLEEAEKQFSK